MNIRICYNTVFICILRFFQSFMTYRIYNMEKAKKQNKRNRLTYLRVSKSSTNIPKDVESASAHALRHVCRPTSSRHSKSFSDLMANSGYLLVNNSLKCIKNVCGPSIKPTRKIKNVKLKTEVNKVDKRKGEHVAEVGHGDKLSDHDYKAKYMTLSDKYAILKLGVLEKNQRLCKALMENEKHILKIDQLQQSVTKLKDFEKKHTGCNKRISRLEMDISISKRYSNDLANSVTHIKAEFESIQNQYHKLCKEYKKIEHENQYLNLSLKNAIGKNAILSNELMYSEDFRRQLHNTVQNLQGNIRVYCRIRPAMQNELHKLLCSVEYTNENNIEIRKNINTIKTTEARTTFTFDKVFQPDSSQEEVFEELGQLVQSALDGYNICVFAYGQTGSGKTFTMQGTPEKLGMIPRAIDLLFHKIERLKLVGWKHQVLCSVLEIYNETINDLLKPGMKKLYINFNHGHGVTVANLHQETITSALDFRNLNTTAEMNRAVAATNYNEHSSRSHSVTKITITGKHKDATTEYYGTVVLIDLAGSENPKQHSPDRIKETKSINKSLSTLGTVMLALYNKDKHIPFRNSKLTYLLQSSLVGNSKTLMFVNIAPFEDCFGESVNSLRFASKVKQIKTGNGKSNK